MNYVTIPEEKENMLKQFIRGSLLGDGSIPKIQSTGKNYRLCFSHGPKQECYINWKQSILDEFDLSGKIGKTKSISSRYKNGYCEFFTLKSRTHPLFTEFRNKYYVDNKKIINMDDISELNEFGLAIWYMDDGSLWFQKNKSTCAILHTTGFSEYEVKFLIEMLYKKWKIIATYYKSENSIRITSKSTIILIDLVRPYIQSCLQYKTVHVKSDELLELHLS